MDYYILILNNLEKTFGLLSGARAEKVRHLNDIHIPDYELSHASKVFWSPGEASYNGGCP